MKDNNEILKWDYLNVFFELLWGWVGIGNGEQGTGNREWEMGNGEWN